MYATTREKAVLFALAAGAVDGWKAAYIAAQQRPEKDVQTAKALNTLVTRWKQRPEIVKAYEEAQKTITAHDMDVRQRGKQDAEEEIERRQEETDSGKSERAKPGRAAVVDYSNPDERKRLYNKIIREATDDPKTQLDAAKLIEQTQREDRQAAQDRQIQRYYMPLQCTKCPLYLKKSKHKK